MRYAVAHEFEGVVVYLTDEGTDDCEVWSTNVEDAELFSTHEVAVWNRDDVGEGFIVEVET